MSALRGFLVFLSLCVCCSVAANWLDPRESFNNLESELAMTQMNNNLRTRDTANCGIISCVPPGSFCNYSLTATTIPRCGNFSSCNSSTNVCELPTYAAGLGANCSDYNPCPIGLDCYYGVCTNSYDPGTPCTSDYQCLLEFDEGTNYTMSCVRGKCAGVALGGYCTSTSQCLPPYACSTTQTCSAAQQQGAACRSDSNCVNGLNCVNNTCTPTIPTGSSCDYDNDNCAQDATCAPTSLNGTTYQCRKLFTGAAGSYCKSSLLECGDGMTCIKTSSDNNGVCTKVASTSSYTNCTYGNSSVCRTGEKCTCNAFNGQNQCILAIAGLPTGASTLVQNFFDCMSTCARNDVSCLAASCSSQYCAYYNMYISLLTSGVVNTSPVCVYESALRNFLSLLENGYIQCRDSPITIAAATSNSATSTGATSSRATSGGSGTSSGGGSATTAKSSTTKSSNSASGTTKSGTSSSPTSSSPTSSSTTGGESSSVATSLSCSALVALFCAVFMLL